MDPSETVLVVGATGRLGREVVRRLREQNQPVRAMTRDPAKAESLASMGAEIVQGDLRDPESVERAVEGVRYIVGSSHSIFGRGDTSPQVVDGAGNRRLVDAAKKHGVKHFVYVSAVSVGADNPIDFFRIKHETENYVRSSGLSFSIVRGAAFMEANLDIVGKQFLRNGKIMIFGRGDRKGNQVSVRDVATFVLLGLDDPRMRNRLVEVCGPQNLSQLEVANTYSRVTGRKAKLLHIPVPVLRVARGVLGLFHPAARRILTVGIMSATEDMSSEMTELSKEFSIEPICFEDVVRTWFESASTTSRA